MIVNVGEHKLTINKSPVNELEVNVTKIEFVFDETIPSNYVKKAFFTNGDVSKVIELVDDECNIPSEVLHKKGQVRLGVIAYEVENETLIERFNPTPTYFEVWEGSMVEADNTEPITPTDKEQIEQQLNDISNQMDNLDVEAEKVEHTTTITITKKDGTSYDVQVLDGEQGPQGEPGQPGAIKMLIVETLPQVGSSDTLYFVPKEDAETSDLYDEYAWVNNAWERLGEKQIVVDLSNYYTKQETYSKTETNTLLNGKANTSDIPTKTSDLQNDSGFITSEVNNLTNYYTKTEIDNTIGNIATAIDLLNGEVI